MDTVFTDTILTALVTQLERLIFDWCQKHDLWRDCRFISGLELLEDTKGNECVLSLWCDGHFVYDFYDGSSEYIEDFDTLILENTPFFYEFRSHVEMGFWVKDNECLLKAAFNSYEERMLKIHFR